MTQPRTCTYFIKPGTNSSKAQQTLCGIQSRSVMFSQRKFASRCLFVRRSALTVNHRIVTLQLKVFHNMNGLTYTSQAERI